LRGRVDEETALLLAVILHPLELHAVVGHLGGERETTIVPVVKVIQVI
jgi:hypothetical protein